ncbi:MAG: TonB-dependent receptor, partial [Salinimicrobium sp.]
MSKNSLSDAEGEADVSAFSENEIIFFRHVAHRDFHSTKRQILQRGNEVFLQPNENLLNEVVLSVSKFPQQKRELAQKVVSFDQQDIFAASPQTSADLLQKTGQVYVQKSQLGGGSPMIRGFATNRLLITVDGVRMNSAIFRSGNLQNVISIDPLAVEDVEVLFGPGSVIYGSDAIGGVMNFYTLSPQFSSEEVSLWSGSAYTRYATANEEKTAHVDLNYGRQKWAFLSSFSFSDFGDLEMGSHGPEEYLRPEYVVRRDGQDVVVENPDPKVQVPTGYEQYNFLQKIRFQPSADWDLNLGLTYTTTSDFPRYDRLYRKKGGQLRAAKWYYGPQEWLQANFRIEKAGNGRLYDDARFIAAYQKFRESRNDRDFGAEILFETREEVDAWSANLDFEKGFFGSKLFYGLEYVLNNVNSTGAETNIITGEVAPGGSRYPNASSWQSMAAYASWKWQLRPDLHLQAGARYSHILLDATFDPEVYDFPFEDANLNTGAFTGSAGLRWQQNDIFGWRFNLSSAFRAPNIDDVGKIFDSEPGAVVVPNPDLKPETAYNAELGSRMDLGRLQLDLSAYYTYLSDAL